MTEYTLMNLSHSDAQSLGSILSRAVARMEKRVSMARENTAYTKENMRKYGEAYWKPAHEANIATENRLASELVEIERIYRLMLKSSVCELTQAHDYRVCGKLH